MKNYSKNSKKSMDMYPKAKKRCGEVKGRSGIETKGGMHNNDRISVGGKK